MTFRIIIFLAFLGPHWLVAQTPVVPANLAEAKLHGAKASIYHQASAQKTLSADAKSGAAPVARLDEFKRDIQPVLQAACVACHGPDKQKADFRVDTLDPNLLTGDDVSWWLEIVDVISNGDMPPEDNKKDIQLADKDRAKVIDWLSEEIQVAAHVRRAEQGHSSFRRLTRYEYNYALQDLLGLPYNFADDLPPETTSEDGFRNSSEMLQMSTSQFETYRELGRKALEKATVRGERPAEMIYNLVEMTVGRVKEAAKRVNERAPHYRDQATGIPLFNAGNNYRGRALEPVPKADPKEAGTSTNAAAASTPILVLPGRSRSSWALGINLPEQGNLHLRIRAARTAEAGENFPSLRILFGFQASNNSKVTVPTAVPDIEINSPPGESRMYEASIPLSEIDRNPYRGRRIPKINSSESIVLANVHPESGVGIHIESIEVTTPQYEQWPPESHHRVFPSGASLGDAATQRKLVGEFMQRAWRRSVTTAEVDRKLKLYAAIRPSCEDDQEALIEVLSTVLASPHFLYLTPPSSAPDAKGFQLASRLSTFLWSSMPDSALLQVAEEGKLKDPAILGAQVERMLADPRAERFHQHFVHQWLGMEGLDHLQVDRKIAPGFNEDLRAAMGQEPIAFFREVLDKNQSIMDFIHADFTMANETLATLYGIEGVEGQAFQRVSLDAPGQTRRGGLLTQAGLLAMNSDGKHSHPLKRGIWLLENILNDPPPPPPPSVPEIDLADPEIAKLTLIERMEDHRNDPACMSCHQRIDPWGIAFENFDAVGRWRDKIDKKPVVATSTLFNKQELAGIEGLKRHLLLKRQDQFARALVHKLAAYALGRPIAFADHANLEAITAELRQSDDGLKTLIRLLVTSDLFQS